MVKEDHKELLDKLNKQAVVLNVMEIEGVKPLMERWITRMLELKGKPNEMIQIPIPEPVFFALTRTKFLQGIKIQMEGWHRDVIRDLSKTFYDEAEKLLEAVGKVKTSFSKLDTKKDELAEIINQYSLVILNYAQKELTALYRYFESQYEISVAKPDFDDIEEQIENIRNIPIDKEIATQPLLFTGSRGIRIIEETPLESGERYIVIQKETETERCQYVFVLPENAKDPTFSKNTQRVFHLINLYAYAEKTLDPFIMREYLIKKLGGGKQHYGTIDNHLEFLTTATYKFENKAKGKDYRKEIGHLINSYKQIGKGKGSYYHFRLNPDYHKYLNAVIEGKTGKELPPYVKIPTQKLLQFPKRETGIVDLLIKHRGQRNIYSYLVRTILKKGLGLTNKEIETGTISRLSKKLDEGLKIAEKYNFGWRVDQSSIMKLVKKTWFTFSDDDIKKKGFFRAIKEGNEAWDKKNVSGLNKTRKQKGIPVIKPFKDRKTFLKIKITFMDLENKKNP